MTSEPARHTNLVSMFFDQANSQADRPFLWRRCGGRWTARSWTECRRAVTEASRGLRLLGLTRGDRVVLVSENRPEWLLADLAIMAAGGVTVPAFTTHTAETHRHIFRNTGARVAIVSSRDLGEKILEAAGPDLACLVSFDPPEGDRSGGPTVRSWESLCDAGRQVPFDVETEAAGLTRRDLACIQHTSGTGGLPRGAMLSHGAILSNLEGARTVLLQIGLGEEVFLSFLPASHSYEHTVGQHFPVSLGAQIYYLENASQVAGALVEVGPTILIAVPRLFESIHRKMTRDLERRRPIARRLFRAAITLGRRRLAGDRLSFPEQIVDRILDRWVRDPVRARFGGRLKAIVSGGAPISPELVRFFHAAGLRLLQGYGLTEASPVVSVNPPLAVKPDSVGTPLAGVSVRLAEDGEVLVQGELLMDGYWNDPQASATALSDGWLCTGDIGSLDEEGYLRITDRKKDFLKTTGGEMVAPQRIEGMLMLEREIAQAMVFGDGRPHLVAVLVPDLETLEGWAQAQGIAVETALGERSAEFQAFLRLAVERVNRRLAGPERIRRFHVASEPFTIENEQLTPTLKLRRHRILERYHEEIERLYDAAGRTGHA